MFAKKSRIGMSEPFQYNCWLSAKVNAVVSVIVNSVMVKTYSSSGFLQYNAW